MMPRWPWEREKTIEIKAESEPKTYTKKNRHGGGRPEEFYFCNNNNKKKEI